ncbi:MAG: VCBS repeat-containing protein [Planctomycetaceae bacterium]|nr:VCBS repeat-containing protein [Planctomycetales bacterium]MCB9924821.1 VCBS repeat-containing protein [Planctomycetaceae bacterium]
MPDPTSFPRRAWYDEVQQGYSFYWDSGRKDLAAPPLGEVVSFFQSQAPEEIARRPTHQEHPTKLFDMEYSQAVFPPSLSFPGVSYIRWQPQSGKAPTILFCDMAVGNLRRIEFSQESPRHGLQTTLMSNIPHPAHVEPCDLDADGITDYLVAELGSFLPEDHERGKVLWLRTSSEFATFETHVLAEGLGRVADARPADFDGDGDLDIVVGEFGWRKSGRVLMLDQVEVKNGIPKFDLRVLDPRHGAIHTEISDIDNDGWLDFVTLFGQEHESVVAFLNQGNGEFEIETIFAAQDPSFGSSGIQLVDWDGDGDQDVLHTNGDTLDSRHLKSSHAVRWLENQGTFPFTEHVLAYLPGAMRALATDMDRDGDLDVVATAFMPGILQKQLEGQFDSLVWLEQTSEHNIVRHCIEHSLPGHMAMEVGDFDGDGNIDIITGSFDKGADSTTPWFKIWWGNDAN